MSKSARNIIVAAHCPAEITPVPPVPTSSSPPRNQGWCLHDFVLHKQLGVGSASIVYQAVHRKTGCCVALKLYFKARMTPLNRHQVGREVAIHARLDHPNIISMFGAFEDRDHVILILEFAAKGDLFDMLRNVGGRMKEREVVRRIMWPFMSGIAHIHAQGIIHRDIKLENTLFSADGTLKIADFGLSVDLNVEAPVTRLGTLDYMSPEVMRCPDKSEPDENKDKPQLAYGTRVDAWACGVLAYELLVGCPPFGMSTREGSINAILNSAPKIPAWLPAGASNFIQEALMKKPSNRPTVRKLLHHPWIQAHMTAKFTALEFVPTGPAPSPQTVNSKSPQVPAPKAVPVSVCPGTPSSGPPIKPATANAEKHSPTSSVAVPHSPPPQAPHSPPLHSLSMPQACSADANLGSPLVRAASPEIGALHHSPSMVMGSHPTLRHAPAHANANVPPRPQSTVPTRAPDMLHSVNSQANMLGTSPPTHHMLQSASVPFFDGRPSSPKPEMSTSTESLHAHSILSSLPAQRSDLSLTSQRVQPPEVSAAPVFHPHSPLSPPAHASSMVFVPPRLAASPSIEHSLVRQDSPSNTPPVVSASSSEAAHPVRGSAHLDSESVPPRSHTPCASATMESMPVGHLYPKDWLASEYYARGGDIADSRFAAASMELTPSNSKCGPVVGGSGSLSATSSHTSQSHCYNSGGTRPQHIDQDRLQGLAHPSSINSAAGSVPMCRSPPPTQLVSPLAPNPEHITETMCEKLRLASPSPDLDSSRTMHDWPAHGWSQQYTRNLSHEHIGPHTESSADCPTTPSSLAAFEGCSHHQSPIAGGSPDGSFGFLGSVASMSSMALESVASPTARRGSGSGAPSNAPSTNVSLRCMSGRSDRSACSTKLPSVVCSLGSRPGSVKHGGLSAAARMGLQQHHSAVNSPGGWQPPVRNGGSVMQGANAWPLDRAARIGEQMVMKAAEQGLHGRMVDGQLVSGFVEVPGGIMWSGSTSPSEAPAALNVWEHSSD